MNVWRNAGTKWYRRAYEANYGGVHAYGYTYRGARKRAEREYEKLVTRRADR